MTRSAFVRARRPEHKQQRREAILGAARDLARSSGVGNVSLGAVAEAVGLVKSNLARYFTTREEIYLELLSREWREWSAVACARLRDARGTTEAVAGLAETLVDRPLFCDLLSHLPTSLEQNVSIPAARTFKHTVHELLGTIGAEIARSTELTEREGGELVAIATSLAGPAYRAANPSPAVAQVYAEDPELAASRPAQLPALVRALSAVAAGFPTLRDPNHR